MSKPEQDTWDALRPVMAQEGLDPRRVENVVGPGHPDVNYAGGDLELKVLECFPARPTTLVCMPEFTGEQAGWLLQRQRAGGRAFLMARVEREWFLFDAEAAYLVYRGLTQAEWREKAVWTARNLSGSSERLEKILRGKE